MTRQKYQKSPLGLSAVCNFNMGSSGRWLCYAISANLFYSVHQQMKLLSVRARCGSLTWLISLTLSVWD